MNSISVVIPLFNKAPHILRAIKSVIRQIKLPREIIVIDDGSTDGGNILVEQIQNPLIRLVRQENQGVSAARNIGISLAKGELIACLDADDEWKPDFLKVIADLRQHYPQAGAYATAYDIIDPKGRKIIKKFKVLSPACKHQLIENMFHDDIDRALLWTSAVVIPKTVFKKVGFFKVGNHFGEDVDMWIRIGIYYPIAFNNMILATYRQDASNRTYKVKKFYYEPAFSNTVRNAILSEKLQGEKYIHLREFGAYWQYWAVRHLIKNNMNKMAIKLINETRRTKAFYRQGWILLILAQLPSFCMKLVIRFYNILLITFNNYINKITL